MDIDLLHDELETTMAKINHTIDVFSNHYYLKGIMSGVYLCYSYFLVYIAYNNIIRNVNNEIGDFMLWNGVALIFIAIAIWRINKIKWRLKMLRVC